MNLIAELLALGGLERVALFAEEAAKVAAGIQKATRGSIMGRAVKALRKWQPSLTEGKAGYEAARNIFRMQLRRANRALRFDPTNNPPPRSNPDPASPPRRVPRRQAENYTLRVEILSQFGARQNWVIVRVVAPSGATQAELNSYAERAVADLIAADTTSGRLTEKLGERRRIGRVEWIG